MVVKIPKLILGRPKIVVDVKCPKCKSLDIAGIPVVDVTCKNCKTRFTTEAGVNIYYSIAKKLTQLVSNNNEVWIVGQRDDSFTFDVQDLLKPRSKHEDDIFHTLLAIKYNYEKQRCWDVSEITNEVDLDYKSRCNECGICHNCVVCVACKHKYIPKKTKTGENRYTCPECNSKKYKPNYIKFKDKKCPDCGSAEVSKLSFNSVKRQCPKCGCKVSSDTRKIPIYKLIIKRQPRNEIRE